MYSSPGYPVLTSRQVTITYSTCLFRRLLLPVLGPSLSAGYASLPLALRPNHSSLTQILRYRVRPVPSSVGGLGYSGLETADTELVHRATG
jgi:hypothetical protein